MPKSTRNVPTCCARSRRTARPTGTSSRRAAFATTLKSSGRYTLRDFKNVEIGFLRVEEGAGGEKREAVDWVHDLPGIAKNEWLGRDGSLTWDGTTYRGEPSLGLHQILVSGWGDVDTPWHVDQSTSRVTIDLE